MAAGECSTEGFPESLLFPVILTLGAAVSYVPQHLKFFWSKSSHGISYWTLLLSLTSCYANALNAFILQFRNIRCCPAFV